jgi:flagellar M-ring protein FliF
MAEEKRDPLAGIKKILNRYSPSRKVLLGSVLLLVIVGIILLVNLAAAPRYGVLYTNLSARDSGLILEQLKAKKVPYRLENGGSIIKVPDSRTAELRMELARASLPEGGGSGFEIFGKNPSAASDLAQDIKYLRAIEDELARTITQLREVSSAKVHITMPRHSVFIGVQEEAKASIVLNLRPGARVSGTLVPAILHLTAQAVEGLKPGNIAIVDTNGNLLYRPSSGEEDIFGERTNTQLAYQRNLEQTLAKRIIDLLEPYVGTGKIRADVKLRMNFDKVETTEEKVDPDSITKVSEKSETSSSGGAAATPAKSRSEKSLINYKVSKTVTHLTKPSGEIRQISVAVVVDDAVEVQLQKGELIRKPRKRTAAELESIKKIARATVGFNTQRGDIIEVANLPFDTSAETVSQYYDKKQKSADLINTLVKFGIYALGFLLLLFVILKPAAKKLNEIIKAARLPKAQGVGVPRVDSDKLAALQEAKDEAEIAQELLEKYKIPKSARKMAIIREKVKRFASENIDETASLVKSFLIEE